MQVSVETLKGLERKLTVSVPANEVDSMVKSQLIELAKKVKLDGFRPGRAPLTIVKQRFLASVHNDVMEKIVRDTLPKAFDQSELRPAAYPTIEPEAIKSGEDFVYKALFEVLPEVKIADLGGAKVEIIESEVTDKDLDSMIEKLREQHKDWTEVKRKSKNGDKVQINFEGFLEGVEIKGGKAEKFDLELGSDSMIPGFEKNLIGHGAGESFDIEVKFPENYHQKELSGKNARFAIDLLKVFNAKLPELDDKFASKFGIEEGGIKALREDISKNMVRELERRLSELNRDKVFDAFLKVNSIDVPKALVKNEIDQLKKDMLYQNFGHENLDQKSLDLPNEMFEKQAEKRVKLGLLFSEFVKKFEVDPTDEQVNKKIDKLAEAYEEPEAFKKHNKSDKSKLDNIRSLVIEEQVADKLLESAKKTKKELDYDSVMNPKQDEAKQGE